MAPYTALRGVFGVSEFCLFPIDDSDIQVQQDILSVADPKALQYIFHSSGYRFPKTRDVNRINGAATGRGLIFATGMSGICGRGASLSDCTPRRNPPASTKDPRACFYSVSTPTLSERLPGVGCEGAAGLWAFITVTYSATLAYGADQRAC